MKNEIAPYICKGPIELFGFLTPENLKRRAFPAAAFTFNITYLAQSLKPVVPVSGPAVIPQATYDDSIKGGKQYDLILVPGGASR